MFTFTLLSRYHGKLADLPDRPLPIDLEDCRPDISEDTIWLNVNATIRKKKSCTFSPTKKRCLIDSDCFCFLLSGH